MRSSSSNGAAVSLSSCLVCPTPRHPRCDAGIVRRQLVSSRQPHPYIPHTVISRPSNASSRRKILSLHGLPDVRSKTARWPSSAPHRSM